MLHFYPHKRLMATFGSQKAALRGIATAKADTAGGFGTAMEAYLTNGFSPFTASAGVMRLPPLSRSMST